MRYQYTPYGIDMLLGHCTINTNAGGVAAARRGLFYGVWLGGMFTLFRNHVSSLEEQAKLEEGNQRLRLAQVTFYGRTFVLLYYIDKNDLPRYYC